MAVFQPLLTAAFQEHMSHHQQKASTLNNDALPHDHSAIDAAHRAGTNGAEDNPYKTQVSADGERSDVISVEAPPLVVSTEGEQSSSSHSTCLHEKTQQEDGKGHCEIAAPIEVLPQLVVVEGPNGVQCLVRSCAAAVIPSEELSDIAKCNMTPPREASSTATPSSNQHQDNDGDDKWIDAAGEDDDTAEDGYLKCSEGDTLGTAVPSPDLCDTVVPRYVLIKQLGTGQSSKVWLALDRSVPLKNYFILLQQKQQQHSSRNHSHPTVRPTLNLASHSPTKGKKSLVLASPNSSASKVATSTPTKQPVSEAAVLRSPFVAVKICRCEKKLVDCVEYELALHRFLEEGLPAASSTPGSPPASTRRQQQPQHMRGVGATYDYFLHQGHFGVHPCVTFEVLGEPLDHLMQAYSFKGITDMRIVKALMRSMLEALVTMHTVHMMHLDLKPENMLLASPSADVEHTMRQEAEKRYKREVVIDSFEATSTHPQVDVAEGEIGVAAEEPEPQLIRSSSSGISPLSGSQSSLRRSASSLVGGGLLDEFSIKIVDLGLSYLVPIHLRSSSSASSGTSLSTPRTGTPRQALSSATQSASSLSPARSRVSSTEEYLLSSGNYHKGTVVQTREYRAPEIILGSDFTCATDIWSIGCIAYELITGKFLFDPKFALDVADENDVDEFFLDMQHLRDVHQVLGAPPVHWLRQQQGTRTQCFYNLRSGQLEGAEALPRKDILEGLRDRFDTDKECGQFVDFLFSCVQWDRAKRKTAVQLLNHEWLQSGYF